MTTTATTPVTTAVTTVPVTMPVTTSPVSTPVTAPVADKGEWAGRWDGCSAEEILELLAELAVWPGWGRKRQQQTLLGAAALLDWLTGFPGQGWQQRWLVAADTEVDKAWLAGVPVPGRALGTSRAILTQGLAGLLLARVIAPGYGFLAGYGANSLFTELRRVARPELFDAMAARATATGMPAGRVHVGLVVLAKLVLRTGRDLDQLTFAEFTEFHQWGQARDGVRPEGILPAWDLLRGIGVVPDHSYRALRHQGQRPTAELVARYRIRCHPVREVLVRYLDERRPSLDYKSLLNMTGYLCGRFWADIEAHHPEQASLHLPAEVAAAWRERLAVVTTRDGRTRPRRNHLQVLMQVRAFYLDIQQWALEDPSWAEHAVPSPVRRADTAGLAKQKRRVTAAMHQRVRDRLPRLPVLAEAANRHRITQHALLTAAAHHQPGERFAHDGVRYQRFAHRRPRRENTHRAEFVLARTDDGQLVDLTKAEDDAFWAWAIIETLRHTGVRLEELLEITHLALVSYRLPDTDELVPLLQVLPSKTDQERLLLISPELASVLACIVSRLRDTGGGAIPLTSHYDRHERIDRPPMPHLFQRVNGHRHEVINVSTVQDLLDATVTRAGLLDAAGQPLRFTPHDFRRMFATDAVTGGLPVHIAARLLGHQHLASTQAYLAVFQDGLIKSYRAFLEQRRATRPNSEYREPTDNEWQAFQRHFALRKLELGTCARPYGTPCQHEHTCIRCPMLRVDPTQRRRLAEIITNLGERISEARLNGWLGEVEGLRVSLRAAQDKLAALDRQAPGPTLLGTPTIVTDGAGREPRR
jgi:integrase